jgi:hypothetical protein
MVLSTPCRDRLDTLDASTRWSHACPGLRGTTLLQNLLPRSSDCVLVSRITASKQLEWIILESSLQKHLMIIFLLEHQCGAFRAHVHTQNRLAESLTKKIKLIARPLLQDSRLSTSCWGHAALHAAALIQYRPSAYHSASFHQLPRGQQPIISHMQKFSCVVYISISPPQRFTMGPHRKLGIYVGYDTPSIIKYLEPKTRSFYGSIR